MDRVWVMAADSRRARLFEWVADGDQLVERETLVNPASRMPGRELETERPGRASTRRGGRRQTYTPPTTPHEHERDRFALAVAERLSSARRRGEFQRVYLIAEPAMLGAVRGALDTASAVTVAGEFAAGMAAQDAARIRELLPRRP